MRPLIHRTADPDLAISAARAVLRQRGGASVPVDVAAIVNEFGIDLQGTNKLGNSASGCLMRVGTTFGILFDASVPSVGFQRFTIGHELGHFRMTHHHQALFPAGALHQSDPGFVSNRWHELEADHFAAELLMPRDPFVAAIDRHTPGLDAVREIAEEFETSLTSTAIRFAKLSSEPVAAVVSQDRAVRYCWVSEALGNVPGIGRIPLRPGDSLPSSATLSLNSNPQNVRRAHRVAVNCRSDAWFSGVSATFALREEAIGLGSYGRVLTILTADDVPDPDDYDSVPHCNSRSEDPWDEGWGTAQGGARRSWR